MCEGTNEVRQKNGAKVCELCDNSRVSADFVTSALYWMGKSFVKFMSVGVLSVALVEDMGILIDICKPT